VKRLLQIVLVIAAFLSAASAQQLAHLRNGFNLRFNHKEVQGANTRLYLDSGSASFVDVPTSDIADCEADTVAAVNNPKPATVGEDISRASDATGIDEDFLASVIHNESDFNPHAVSPKGAQGLMQLMPQTAARLGVRNAFDPAENIDAGSRYLRQLLARYNGDAIKALAAYNAGPGRVEQFNGVPPFTETRDYVTRVIREFNRRKERAAQTARKETATQKSTN